MHRAVRTISTLCRCFPYDMLHTFYMTRTVSPGQVPVWSGLVPMADVIQTLRCDCKCHTRAIKERNYFPPVLA